MSKKVFFIILVLSVVVTYGVAYMDFAFKLTADAAGLPFGFSRFNFLGGETDEKVLILDVAFWFIIIWVLLQIQQKITRK